LDYIHFIAGMLCVTSYDGAFRVRRVEPHPLGVCADVLCDRGMSSFSAYVDCRADDAFVKLRRLFGESPVYPVDVLVVEDHDIAASFRNDGSYFTLPRVRTPFLEHFVRCQLSQVRSLDGLSQVRSLDVLTPGWGSFMRAAYDAGWAATCFRVTVNVAAVDDWFPVRCTQVLFLCSRDPARCCRLLSEFVSAAVADLVIVNVVDTGCVSVNLLQNVHAVELTIRGKHCFRFDFPRIHVLRLEFGADGCVVGADFTLCSRLAFVLCERYDACVYPYLLEHIPTLLQAPRIHDRMSPSDLSEMRACVARISPLLLTHFDTGVIEWSPRVHRVFYSAHSALCGAFLMMLDRAQEGAVPPELVISRYDPAAVEHVFRHFDAMESVPARVHYGSDAPVVVEA